MGCFPTKIDQTLRLPSDNRSPMSISSRETEKQWCNLPSPALENIYCFARRGDQFNMSLVCRQWSEGFHSPAVRKTFRFALTESQLSTDNSPMMAFVQKYSFMFRFVKIECIYQGGKHLIKTWCRHFTAFLQILTENAQLISIEFHNLSLCFWQIDSPTYQDVIRAVADFLKSQHRLKRVEFDHCLLRFQEGAEFLRTLTENSKKSLTYLVLRNFVLDEEEDSSAVQNLITLENLPRLRTLEVDYSILRVVFENMVARQPTQAVKKCQQLALSKLILHHDKDMDSQDLGGLTSTDWRFLKILFPYLKLEVIIDTCSLFQRDEKFFFIVPNMPITHLTYKRQGLKLFRRETIVRELFRRLLECKINDYLVSSSLEPLPPILDLASIIPFLSACKKLKRLELYVNYATNGIYHLMESWLHNRPVSLENVLIEICDRKRR